MEQELTKDAKARLLAAAKAWDQFEEALGPVELRFDDTAGRRMMNLLDQLLELQDESDSDEHQPPSGLHRLACFVQEWVELYDERVFPSSQLAPIDLIKHLMASNGLRQKDLASLFGGQSVVSLVLRGKRTINIHQARALAKHFSMKVSAFFPDADAESAAGVVSKTTGGSFHVFQPIAPVKVVESASVGFTNASYICH